MKRVHIFGCSFSANYSKKGKVFPLCEKYITREEELGNKIIKSVNYWYKETLGEVEVYNYAKGGNSNDQIFHDFFKYSNRIRPGDFVLVQLSFLTRVRIVNLMDRKWINFQPPASEDLDKRLTAISTHTSDTVNRICLERASTSWLDYIGDTVDLIRRYCDLSNAISCITTLDTQALTLDKFDLPQIYGKSEAERIKDRFPDMNDFHYTYEGTKKIVETITEFFLTKEEEFVSKALLPPEILTKRISSADSKDLI